MHVTNLYWKRLGRGSWKIYLFKSPSEHGMQLRN